MIPKDIRYSMSAFQD